MTESLAKVKSFRYFEKFYKIYLGGGISPPPPPRGRTGLRKACTLESTAQAFVLLPELHIVSNESNGNILKPSCRTSKVGTSSKL